MQSNELLRGTTAQEFHVATRQRDTKGQLDAIERAKALPAFSAEHFAKMAAAVKGAWQGAGWPFSLLNCCPPSALCRVCTMKQCELVSCKKNSLAEFSKNAARPPALLAGTQCAAEGPHKSLDVCRAAELAALQRLTSEPALNYPVVAAVSLSFL